MTVNQRSSPKSPEPSVKKELVMVSLRRRYSSDDNDCEIENEEIPNDKSRDDESEDEDEDEHEQNEECNSTDESDEEAQDTEPGTEIMNEADDEEELGTVRFVPLIAEEEDSQGVESDAETEIMTQEVEMEEAEPETSEFLPTVAEENEDQDAVYDSETELLTQEVEIEEVDVEDVSIKEVEPTEDVIKAGNSPIPENIREEWRPREPKSSNRLIEVDEEIEDAPLQPCSLSNFEVSPRQRSRSGRYPLSISRTRRSKPPDPSQERPIEDSQGSIELGDPEAQIYRGENVEEPLSEATVPFTSQTEPFSQQTFEPPSSAIPQSSMPLPNSAVQAQSYFKTAQASTRQPLKKGPSAQRSKSMFVQNSVPFPPQEILAGQMASGITYSSAFRSTPFKSSPQMPRLPSSQRGSQKSLKDLTRRASQRMGTAASSPVLRGRSVSQIPHLLQIRGARG